MKRFKAFFVSRTFSAVGDEMWLTALPIFLGAKGIDILQLGGIQAFAGVGALLGFFAVPFLARRFKSAIVAVFSDSLQLILFLFLGVFLFQNDPPNNLWFWGLVAFFVSMFAAVWFASTETLLSVQSSRQDAQSVHRWNFLAGYTGPALGPSLGGVLFQLGGIHSIILANLVSFVGQIFTLSRLSANDEIPSGPIRREKRSFTTGISLFLGSPIYLSIVTLPVLFKISILGILPFIPFLLTKEGHSPILVGAMLSAFTVGSLFGAIIYRPAANQILAHRFFWHSMAAMFFTALIVLIIKVKVSLWLLGVALVFAGLFMAWYTIELRSIRQLLVSKEDMATTVSSMGFVSRLVTPLGPILWSYALSTSMGLKGAFMIAFGLLIAAFAGGMRFKHTCEAKLKGAV